MSKRPEQQPESPCEDMGLPASEPRRSLSLCQLLGAIQGSPEALAPALASEELLEEAQAAGVASLLFAQYARVSGIPEVASTRLRRFALHAETLELGRQEALSRLLEALAEVEIPVLLMKGAALAYSLYPSPGLRPRVYTDILVRESDVAGVRDMLRELGYELSEGDTDSRLSYQLIASRFLFTGYADNIDVHWRISNRQQLADAFSFDELWTRSAVISNIGPKARGLGPIDALMLACLHRVAHLSQGQPERLIWLYDIHLLVEALSDADRERLVALMQSKNLMAVCSEGIRKTAACFGTDVGAQLGAVLEKAAPEGTPRGLLGAGPLKVLWLQFREQPDWRHRLRLARELGFPPADYMRRKYPESRSWLPALYLRRALEGVRKRM